MAKTQITRTSSGWVDNDDPTVLHPNRRTAREARRKSLYYQGKTGHLRSLKSKPTSTTAPTFTVTQPLTGLTGLQRRLYDRLIYQQGVTTTEAYFVVTKRGYNAAASYGHMREAGANHSEALSVIDLGSPNVSRAYGQHRAVGFTHTDALRDAIIIGGMEDDDDNDNDD